MAYTVRTHIIQVTISGKPDGDFHFCKVEGILTKKISAHRQDERFLERVMGFEPTISCLGSKRSTTELHPLVRKNYTRCNTI